MIRSGSLFSQVLTRFQRSESARRVRTPEAEHRAKGISLKWS